jgi:hypothetical protein
MILLTELNSYCEQNDDCELANSFCKDNKCKCQANYIALEGLCQAGKYRINNILIVFLKFLDANE